LHGGAVRRGQCACTAEHEPFIEGEEFHAHDRGVDKSRDREISNLRVRRPAAVLPAGDYREHEMRGAVVEGEVNRTRAGRRFVAALSVNGKGTTTASKRLQVGVGTVVLGGVPLVFERVFYGVGEHAVDRPRFLEIDLTGLEFEGDRVAGLEAEFPAHPIRDGRLAFAGELADGERLPDE